MEEIDYRINSKTCNTARQIYYVQSGKIVWKGTYISLVLFSIKKILYRKRRDASLSAFQWNNVENLPTVLYTYTYTNK